VYLIYIGASMIIQLIHEDSITSDYWIQLLYYGINLIFLMFSRRCTRSPGLIRSGE